MSKEKQTIEEMAKDVTYSIVWDSDGYATVDCLATAKKLHLKGYHRQSEWISVDERLPEREGKYLVCTTNGNIGVGNFIDYYGKGTHLCFDCWAVTHWMPLPEPPKMRKEDDGK